MMVHLGKGFWLVWDVPGKQDPTWGKTLYLILVLLCNPI